MGLPGRRWDRVGLRLLCGGPGNDAAPYESLLLHHELTGGKWGFSRYVRI